MGMGAWRHTLFAIKQRLDLFLSSSRWMSSAASMSSLSTGASLRPTAQRSCIRDERGALHIRQASGGGAKTGDGCRGSST